MKIVDIRCSVHRIETTLPLTDKPSRDSARLICEIETDEGHTGVGMAAKFLIHGVASVVEHHITPRIMGEDPRNVERIHAMLYPLVTERGHQSGINLAAVSAVDLALWDIAGKAAGRSVAQLVGGFRDYADVYVTYGFGNYDDDQLVELARMLITEGHSRLKILVGVAKGGWKHDVARVAKVREAVGEGIMLALDANESIPLDYAIRVARGLEAHDIAFFEDPVKRNDPRDLAQLRRLTSIPIAVGQMDGHSLQFRNWLEHDAIDIMMPNSLYNGGMTETRRVAALAQIYNRPLSDAGGGGLYSVHHVAGFRGGTLAECHLAVDLVERALFIDHPIPHNGRVSLDGVTGFGIDLNRDMMRDSLVAPK